MHMADALLSPAVGGGMWVVTAGLIGTSSRKVRLTFQEKKIPLMGVAGAFVFAAQMINFTIPATGSSGHLGGGLLLAILLGPPAAFMTIASVLTVQALFFADGGLLALGCNIFNLGFFPCFVAYPWIYRPLVGRARLALALLVVPLALSLTGPLWTIHMVAPQYPGGLDLDIYAHTVRGDVQEINTLNHYIGMQSIDRASLSDLNWLPFALGALALATLRVAAIGNMRMLIDLVVSFGYLSIFAFARFAYRLYVFGHDLDPRAPITVEPFMPAVMGSKQIANFTTTSLPGTGSLWLGAFAIGLVVIAVWNLRIAMRAPTAEQKGGGERL